MMRRAFILAAALLLLPVQSQAQSSFLKKPPPPAAPKPAPAKPAAPTPTPAPKPAATPVAKPAASAPQSQAASKPRSARPVTPANSVPPIVTSAIAVLGAQCRQAGGTPDASEALLSADLNGDGLKDYIIYEGHMGCAGAISYFAPTANAGQKATLFLTQRNGNAVAAWTDQNVWDASLVKHGPKTVLSLDVGGVECPGRVSGSGVRMVYCTRELGLQGGKWALGPIVQKASVASAAPPRPLTVEETVGAIVRDIHLNCDVATVANRGTDQSGNIIYEVVCQSRVGYLLIKAPPDGYGAMNCLYAFYNALTHCSLLKREEMVAAVTVLSERERPDCKVRDIVGVDMTLPVGEETYRVKCGSILGPSYKLKVNNRAP